MRKRIMTLVLAGLFAGGAMGVAQATHGSDDATLKTDQGSLGVNQNGYIIVADGNSNNPDRLSGYIGVTNDHRVVCGSDENAEVGPYNDDGTLKGHDDDGDPIHTDQDCDPQP